MLLFGICAGAAWLMLNLLVFAMCRVMSRADQEHLSLLALAGAAAHSDRCRRTRFARKSTSSGFPGDRRPAHGRDDPRRLPARRRARQRPV